jgi:hypothetical protein
LLCVSAPSIDEDEADKDDDDDELSCDREMYALSVPCPSGDGAGRSTTIGSTVGNGDAAVAIGGSEFVNFAGTASFVERCSDCVAALSVASFESAVADVDSNLASDLCSISAIPSPARIPESAPPSVLRLGDSDDEDREEDREEVEERCLHRGGRSSPATSPAARVGERQAGSELLSGGGVEGGDDDDDDDDVDDDVVVVVVVLSSVCER